MTTTGMASREPAAARTAVKLPKFSGATQLEPYLAQFRLAEWHNGWGAGEAVVHLALALEGTAVQALLDPAPGLGETFRAEGRRQPHPRAANQTRLAGLARDSGDP